MEITFTLPILKNLVGVEMVTSMKVSNATSISRNIRGQCLYLGIIIVQMAIISIPRIFMNSLSPAATDNSRTNAE